MKSIYITLLLIGIFSCQKMEDFKGNDASASEEGYYIKSFLKPDELTSLNVTPPQVLENPTETLINQNYIFIGESAKGVHVYKNLDSPVQIGFISIPAMQNFSVNKGNLIADNGNDLVSYNINGLDVLNFSSGTNGSVIANTSNFGETARLKGFFDYPNYPNLRNVYFECPDSVGFVTEWEKRKVSTPLNCYR